MENNKFTVENLMNGYFDGGNGTYDLEFAEGWIRNIPAGDHPEAETGEFYWDNQENIDRALEQGDVE